MIDENPYASPQAHATVLELPLLPPERWGEIQLRVLAVEQGWFQRLIRIVGSLDAEIRYDPRGHGERVYVNRQLIVTTSPWIHSIVTPHIDFYLETQSHRIPASIDVKASSWRFLKTYDFRLTICGKIYYQD